MTVRVVLPADPDEADLIAGRAFATVLALMDRQRPVMLATHEPAGDRDRSSPEQRDAGRRLGAGGRHTATAHGSVTIEEPASARDASHHRRSRAPGATDDEPCSTTVKRANRPGPPEHSIQLRVASHAAVIVSVVACYSQHELSALGDGRSSAFFCCVGMLFSYRTRELPDGNREDRSSHCSRSGRSHGSS